MSQVYFLIRFFGTLACLWTVIDAREAIVGGQISMSYYHTRYQAVIMFNSECPSCGGGILKSSYILTAANCVIKANNQLVGQNISVLVGTNDLGRTGVVVEVDEIYVPVEYNPRDVHRVGDIAVLKLSTHLDLSNHANLTALKVSMYKVIPHAYKSAIIAGFGWDEMDEINTRIGYYSDQKLRSAVAVIQDHRECQQDHPSLHFSEKNMCARMRTAMHAIRVYGTCFGDTGGPLVVRGNLVIGVLSRTTDECSENNSSAIYTNTGYYWMFIQNIMGTVRSDGGIPYKTFVLKKK